MATIPSAIFLFVLLATAPLSSEPCFPDAPRSALVVASGSSAAEWAGAENIQNLTLVESDLAELQRAKLKVELLKFPPEKRLEILGYSPMEPTARKAALQELFQSLEMEEDLFGDLQILFQQGLGFVGKEVAIFKDVRTHLHPFKRQLEALFSMKEVAEQIQQIAPRTELGCALDEALDTVMTPENLKPLFGEEGFARRAQSFSRYFAERIRLFLSTELASSSPWMAHLFLGHSVPSPWLLKPQTEQAPSLTYLHLKVEQALSRVLPESYEVIDLAHSLDALKAEEARELLRLSFRALKEDGVVVIRQMNSDLDILSLNTDLQWTEERDLLLEKVHLGFKKSDSIEPDLIALRERMHSAELLAAQPKQVAAPSPLSNSFFMNPFLAQTSFYRDQMEALRVLSPSGRNSFGIAKNGKDRLFCLSFY